MKAPDGRLSKQQELEHKRMRAMGQEVIVLYSIEAVEQWFSQQP